MQCHDTELWFSLAFDGRLDDEERGQFESHLDQCASCAGDYAHYESLFGAVRALPSSTTDRPVPIPATSRSFAGGAEAVSLWRRVAQMGAVAGLLVAVGFGAYGLGTASRPADQDLNSTPIANAPIAPSNSETITGGVPAKMPGSYLHRLVRGTKNLGLMVESAGNSGPAKSEDADRALRVIDDYVQRTTLGQDAQRLRAFDANSLRGYTEPVHAFARDVTSIVDEARRELRSGGEPAQSLGRLRALVRRGSLRGHVDRLGSLAELYPLPPRPPVASFPREGSGEWAADQALASSMQLLVCGDDANAGQLLVRVLASGDSTTRTMAQRVAVFHRLKLDGVHFQMVGGFGSEKVGDHLFEIEERFVLPEKAFQWGSRPVFRQEGSRTLTVEKPGQECEMIMWFDGAQGPAKNLTRPKVNPKPRRPRVSRRRL